MDITIAPTLAALLVPLALAVGALVARYGEPLKRLDLERLYLHVLAAVLFFWTVTSVSGLVTFAAMVWSRSGVMEPLRLSERLSTHIAYVLVGLPAWLWSYRRAWRLSIDRRAALMHRGYLYLVALFSALMAVIAGGMLLGQGVRLAMGLVDLSTPVGVWDLQSSLFEWTINAVMYTALWWAHFRAARRWAV